MKYLLSVTLMCLSFVAFSQPELVADINEGEEDSGVYCNFTYTSNQDCVVALGEKYIFIADNEIIGRELYVLDNGVVELIADLNNDVEDSDPQYLTAFQDAVYFIADDNTGYKIWRTDGTAGGTEIAFDLGVDDARRSDYTVFLINQDKLYFNFEGSIYVYDGQVLSEVQHDSRIDVSGSGNYNSRSWSIYKDGIAVMDYNGDTWDLLYIHDGQVDNLMNFNADVSNKNPYAVAGFDGGISFSFDAAFDESIEGRYIYIDGSTEAIKQSDDFTRRNISVNGESCLLYGDNEFILYDTDNLLGVQSLTGTLNLVQGEDWNRIVVGDYLAFQSSGGVFEDDRISLLNTTDGMINTVYEGDELTRLYSLDNNLFFFAESQSSIFNEALYRYDINTDELVQLEELIDLPFNSDLFPIGVQGGDMYFFGNIDEAFGTEVYKIPVDINTANEELDEQLKLSFLQTGTNRFQLVSDVNDQLTVEVYTIDGRLILSQVMKDQGIIEIPYSGVALIKASLDNKSFTELKYTFSK